MKTKKLFSRLAAMAAAAALAASMSIPAAAADWSQTSYADNDPNTVKIISYDNAGVTFTTTETNTDICKARITLDKVLKNPDDYSKIAKAEWTVTYKGVSSAYKGESLSGGTYFVAGNSTGYGIKCDDTDADENPIWNNDTYTVTDSFTASEALTKDGEIVFMDWSFADIGASGITVTVSDFKMYDASGNEIEQLGNGEYTVSAADDLEDAPDETNTDGIASDETAPDEATPVETSADGTTPNADTGNTGFAVASAIAALAATGIILTKTRK